MKWSEMTETERDTLVAEKVMTWQKKPCDYEVGAQSNSSDGWYCLKCGYEGYWGGTYAHEEIPKHYSTDMNAAWQIVELEKWSSIEVRLNHWLSRITDDAPQYICTINVEQKCFVAFRETAQEAICITALIASGVDIEP